jgi:endonuclease III
VNEHARSRFSLQKRIKRIETFGSEDLKQTREKAKRSLEPDAWKSLQKSQRWEAFVEDLSPEKIASHLRVYGEMRHILQVLMDEHGLIPERSCWLDALSARCLIPAGGMNCGSCNGCWAAFVQSYILVKCASGVADVVVCNTTGAIFHSEPYKNYGLKEWAGIPELELASLLMPTSCWAYNTQFILPCLRRLQSQRECKPGIIIPDHLGLMQVYGTNSKSAFLTVEGAFGVEAGIVVDRHVASAAWEFEFVPMESVESEEISVMLKEWLPRGEFARFNETIGGLKQLLGKGKTQETKVAFAVEKRLGYKNIISRLLKM